MTEYGFRIQPMIKPGWSPELLLHVNYINHLKIIRFDLLKKIESLLFADDLNGAQDWDLCLLMIENARRVVHIPLVLYHWRKRKGSMANEVAAKPWAIMGQLNLRNRYAKKIGTFFSFNLENNSFRISQDIMKKSLVHQITKTDLQQTDNDYFKFIEDLIQSFKENDIVFFSFQEKKISREQIDILSGYAKMPFVGCVWPFREVGVRTAYSIFDGGLVPVDGSRSAFSNFTGNVLTGPTDGLVIEVKKLKSILAEIRSNSIFQISWIDPKIEFIGPILGLIGLSTLYRNVSVSEVVYIQQFKILELVDPIIPDVDPYI